ncbi:hypothetical protein NE237_024426 [Protea cynaroides]|uniref:Uncharacterized protein n=1 Tax=Protea cynaroides TaxID=273540 RepID=A0A9Q0K697_9MAGN|nr:hypothetical protein NE237_024426 [Protea cynaroides]
MTTGNCRRNKTLRLVSPTPTIGLELRLQFSRVPHMLVWFGALPTDRGMEETTGICCWSTAEIQAYLAYGVPRSDLKLFSLMQKFYRIGGREQCTMLVYMTPSTMKKKKMRNKRALWISYGKWYCSWRKLREKAVCRICRYSRSGVSVRQCGLTTCSSQAEGIRITEEALN